jgi:hypothetical protein
VAFFVQTRARATAAGVSIDVTFCWHGDGPSPSKTPFSASRSFCYDPGAPAIAPSGSSRRDAVHDRLIPEQHMMRAYYLGLTVFCAVATSSGCIKGPLWQTGYLSPWARQRWADEERLAPSLLTRRADMRAMVQSARRAGESDLARAAGQLHDVALHDPVLLVRMEAVQLLGELDHPQARTALSACSQDPQSEIRLAAVQACARHPATESIPILQQVVGGDSDLDVRLAATRALANFTQPEAIRALGLALDDPNPALQLRAADALRAVSGQPYGRDIEAWRQFVRQSAPPISTTSDSRQVSGEAGEAGAAAPITR